MFFFLAIMPIKKIIPYSLSGICKKCSNICNFVRTDCCSALYSLDKKTGNAIAMGENVPITDDVLTLIDDNFSQIKNCPYCGNEINSDFEYCPKCGKKL